MPSLEESATTDNTTPSSSYQAPQSRRGAVEFLPMSLTLSRLRAVPLTPRRGDYSEISTGLCTSARSCQARKHFLRESRRLGAGGCFGYGQVEPSRQALELVAIRRSFSRKYSNSNDDALLFDHRNADGGLDHMKFGKKRAVQTGIAHLYQERRIV
jgi:hypothetical protein